MDIVCNQKWLEDQSSDVSECRLYNLLLLTTHKTPLAPVLGSSHGLLMGFSCRAKPVWEMPILGAIPTEVLTWTGGVLQWASAIRCMILAQHPWHFPTSSIWFWNNLFVWRVLRIWDIWEFLGIRLANYLKFLECLKCLKCLLLETDVWFQTLKMVQKFQTFKVSGISGILDISDSSDFSRHSRKSYTPSAQTFQAS